MFRVRWAFAACFALAVLLFEVVIRISADPKSQYYSTRSRHATVFLNGVQLTHCFSADDEAGTADCYRVNERGEITHDGEFAGLEVRRDLVDIVLVEMDFDAWLRRRTDRAHTEFMARTARLPA